MLYIMDGLIPNPVLPEYLSTGFDIGPEYVPRPASTIRFPVTPVYPSYLEYHKRIETFSSFPEQIYPRPEELSAAGFWYSGYSDKVVCFFCGLILSRWDSADIALEEHSIHKPECGFLKMLPPNKRFFH